MPNLNKNLWNDELWSTRVKLGDIVSLWNTVWYDFHPPFYSVFMFLWIQLLGDSELSVRFPPLLLGIASIFLTYNLALKFVERRVALLAAWLMAVSPVHIWYSQEARQYSATLFFLLLSLLAYYQLNASTTNRIWYVVYSSSLLFGVLSHYYVGIYAVLISGLCLYKLNQTKRNILYMNIVILSCLGLFVALKSRAFFATEEGYLRRFTPYELWQLLFNWFLSGNSLSQLNERSFLILVELPFFALFLLGAVRFLGEAIESHSFSDLDMLFYLFSLPLFLLVLNEVGFNKIYIERSVFVSLPFFYLILAQGLVFKTRSPTVLAISLTVIFNLLILSTFFLNGDKWTVYKPNADWRAAAHYLADETKDATERVDVFTVAPSLELTYYDPQCVEFADFQIKPHESRETLKRLLEERTNLYQVFSLAFENHDQFLRERLANARLTIHHPGQDGTTSVSDTLSRDQQKIFYLIVNRYWEEDFESLFRGVIQDSRFQLSSHQTFKGIEIFKFDVVPQD